MAEVFFDNPPATRGTAEEQLRSLQSYLGMLSTKLNEAMNQINIEQLEPESRTAIQQAVTNAEVTEDNRQALKALIIKNAEIVKTEMDEYVLNLNKSIEALSSQFGEYQEQVSMDLTATAEGIRQQYEDLEEIISNNQEAVEYSRALSGYIYSGILNVPGVINGELGLAIGQNIQVNNNQLVNQSITITPDQITFYKNGTPIGYYKGDRFYIAKGEVTDSMKMGNFVWKVFANNSLALMKE